jgi:NNP family nitrate/nitrite transporter-like MFS transporter
MQYFLELMLQLFVSSWFCLIRWSFFIAFFSWFAITPLLSEIQQDLHLTKKEIWTSSVASVGSTILVRVLLGPACDKFGARVLFSLILTTTAIPTACTGLIQSARGLVILRSFIGIAGGTFVMCEYWTSRMFALEVVGTANALVAGWGNLGAGVTQIVMGSLLFPLFKVLFSGDSEKAWRTVCIVPAFISFITGVIVFYISDDAPKGNYSEMQKNGAMEPVSYTRSFCKGTSNWNTWYLAIQYACCFGVELTMNNAAALYFRDEFGQTPESAAAIASIFGWMNLFARGVGGFWSDYVNMKNGMKGRLWLQTVLLFGEGVAVLVFAQTKTLAGSIVILIIFSLFVQTSEGASYGIVPYVDIPNTGSVAGIVGAGGNVGATGFGLAFRQLDYGAAFNIMGCTIIASSFLSALIFIDGQSNMWTSNTVPNEPALPSNLDSSVFTVEEGGEGEPKPSQGA